MKMSLNAYRCLLDFASSYAQYACVGALCLSSLNAIQLPTAMEPQRPSEWWHQRHIEKLAEVQQGDDYDIVLIGDSITQYGERDASYGYYFGNRKVLNLGFGGDLKGCFRRGGCA